MRRYAPGLFVALVVVLAACSSAKKDDAVDAKTIRVAAASDLARAFTEVGTKFEAKTGIKTVFDFGSSGLLAHDRHDIVFERSWRIWRRGGRLVRHHRTRHQEIVLQGIDGDTNPLLPIRRVRLRIESAS